jgi:hypothetical protein
MILSIARLAVAGLLLGAAGPDACDGTCRSNCATSSLSPFAGLG